MKQFIYVFVLLFHFCSAFAQDYSNVTISIHDVELISILDDRLRISEFDQFQPVDGKFLIIHRRPNGISVMDLEGHKIGELGSSGFGPFEWQHPSYIQILNDEIIFWDSNSLKFIVFDTQLQPVREIVGLGKAIRGFQFKSKEMLAIYHQPRFEHEFVDLYKLNESGNLQFMRNIGELSSSGRTLLFKVNVGGILWNDDHLIWVDPAIPELNILDIDNDEIFTIPIRDTIFNIEPWQDPDNFTRETFDQIQDYVFNNSQILSLQKLNEYILIEAEHFPDGTPEIHYYLFDKEYNYIGKTSLNDGGWENYIRGVYGNKLFYWAEDYTETGKTRNILVREIKVE